MAVGALKLLGSVSCYNFLSPQTSVVFTYKSPRGKQLQTSALLPKLTHVKLEIMNSATKPLASSYLSQGLSLDENIAEIIWLHMSLALVKDSAVGARGAGEFGSVLSVWKGQSNGIYLGMTLIQCCGLLQRQLWGWINTGCDQIRAVFNIRIYPTLNSSLPQKIPSVLCADWAVICRFNSCEHQCHRV